MPSFVRGIREEACHHSSETPSAYLRTLVLTPEVLGLATILSPEAL
jgi:hypothetical protein